MLQFDIITIFPNIFDSFLKESIIKKAQEKKLIKINIHNLRDWTIDKHKTVDDKPYGGGRGMIMKIEPIYRAVKKIKKKSKLRNKKSKIILFTPRGKKFNQKIAHRLSILNQIIMICGRYEGVDGRVEKHIADLKLSIGDFVSMGGELPAMILIETVARLIPGVLGKPELLKKRITKKKGFIEYPQYTRPEVFGPKKGIKWRVPKVLLSGDHKKIAQWRKKHSRVIEK
ncbi:tRNA (guanine-N1)-methyltransferase [Parcubacteria bacterium DG_74_2]|nr:MAG: tRNA (guanine-N1)-methyltransferase [Parcubacteria bacterium DG_74_2]